MTTTSSSSPVSTPKLRWRFVLHALLWLGLFYAALYYPWPQGSWAVQVLSDYLKLLAFLVGKCLFWMNPAPRVHGDIVAGAFNMQVVLDCGALDVWAMLSAAILATPVPWVRRLIGVALGTVCIFVANLLRLCTLYLIGVWSPDHFHVFHEDVFSFGFVVFTLGIFALWLWYPGLGGSDKPGSDNDGPGDNSGQGNGGGIRKDSWWSTILSGVSSLGLKSPEQSDPKTAGAKAMSESKVSDHASHA